jgi:hypothetical protein
MATPTRDRDVSIVRDAIRNTGKGVWALYILLVSAGVALFILGWQAEVHGWAAGHPYLIGLLDGATGFCFGVPIVGVVITGITGRVRQDAERRDAVHAVVFQLEVLDRLIDGLSPGEGQPRSDRLRELKRTADSAEEKAKVAVEEKVRTLSLLVAGEGKVKTGIRTVIVQPGVGKGTADKLRPAVEDNKLWASIGFSCDRLRSDATRLVTMLYPPVSSQQTYPGWFDELASALQTILVIQLPSHRRWLPAAVKDPPDSVPVEWRRLQGLPADQNIDAEARKDIADAALDDLKEELRALARHLDGLATLVDAAATFRGGLLSDKKIVGYTPGLERTRRHNTHDR